MRINFTKLSPGGNETVIIQSEVRPEQRPAISQGFMNGKFIQSEQVGFLSQNSDTPRLDMMGGELCINALRSTATLLSLKESRDNITLASSGTEQLITCSCVPVSENIRYTALEFPLSSAIQVVGISNGVTIVFLEGITHFLLASDEEVSESKALQIFENVRKQYASSIPQNGAFGVIPYWQNEDQYATAPIVCVPATNTIVPESGCGSGSIALALALNKKEVCITQPSGVVYDVSIQNKSNSRTALLGSNVQLLLTGTAFVAN